VPEKKLTRRKTSRHAEARREIVYQTWDDADYKPPGNTSAKSGEEKKIVKPKNSCRLTKITVSCTHVDDAERKEGGGKKSWGSSKESKIEDEVDTNIVRTNPALYDTVPYQVVAPLTWGIAKQFAQWAIKGTGTMSKWFREDVLMTETITVEVEGYFCKGEHPEITVREVGRKKKSGDSIADIGKDEKVVKLFKGPKPAKDKQKGGVVSGKSSAPESSGETGSPSEATTKVRWFYVGSLMPKFKSAFFAANYLYPCFVSPNIYEIHVKTCDGTRIVYVEVFYEAKYKLQLGHNALAEYGDDDQPEWYPFSPFDVIIDKLEEEVSCWSDSFGSSNSGSLWDGIFKVVRAVKTVLDKHKFILEQDGPGFRVKPELSGDTILKFEKLLMALVNLRKNLKQRRYEHSDHEIEPEYELKAKFLEGSIEANWHHREHGGRRVGWYQDIQANLILIEAEAGLGFSYSPSWTGHLELKGAGKATLSVVVKGRLSTDSVNMAVARYQLPEREAYLKWRIERPDDIKGLPDDIFLEEELTEDIREGIPIDIECKPEVGFEVPVFLEEFFNIAPKAEGGLKGGGFLGFDSDGPCVRLALELQDIGVSLEISALGGWISFTVGPVPIIPVEKLNKKVGKWIDKEYGDLEWLEDGQIRLSLTPKKKSSKPTTAEKPTKV